MGILRRLRNRRRFRVQELAPDEIFLDATNLPDFDQGSLEGKLEKPVSRGSYLGISLAIGVIFIALAAQASNLQLMQGEKYASQSERNRLRPEIIFAQRGAILDRNGVPLVSNVVEDGLIRRVYEGPGFAHVLGYVSYPRKDSSGNFFDTEIRGLAGAEESFNDVLSGVNGRLLVEEDARGTVQSQGSVMAAQDGQNVTLAIDARAQRAFYNAVRDLSDRTPFQGAAAVLMDVETGEVHALVSYPEYDPNILSRGTPAEVIAGYNTNSRQPYLDRAIAGLYAPGSIVKPMEAAAAISDGIISPERTIYSAGSISIPNPYNPSLPSIFKDWKAHGVVDARRAIAVSSDIYFYAISGGLEQQSQRGMGIERLAYWYRAFGFDTPTGVELSGEASGIVPTPAWKEKTFGDPWRLGDTYNTSIGQYGMQVTVMESVRATAAVANGGKLVRPTLLTGQPLSGETIAISRDALRIGREGMRMAVNGQGGTAAGLNALSFTTIAAKTGTAQVGARNEFYNMWAVGFWPYEKPRYAFVVLMDRGPAGTSVGAVSATFNALQELNQTAPEYFQ